MDPVPYAADLKLNFHQDKTQTQKLLYYAHCAFICKYHEGIFSEPKHTDDIFAAAQYGPFLPSVHEKWDSLSQENILDANPHLMSFVETVCECWNGKTATQLKDISHDSPLWQRLYPPPGGYQGFESLLHIPNEQIKRDFPTTKEEKDFLARLDVALAKKEEKLRDELGKELDDLPDSWFEESSKSCVSTE